MAAQAYTPEIDQEDPPRGRHRLLQVTTLTGCEGAPWKALHTALYWAQGSPNGRDTPEPTEAWVMQAKATRNYHLHHPFDDSPGALPWPTDPPYAVHQRVPSANAYRLVLIPHSTCVIEMVPQTGTALQHARTLDGKFSR